MDCTGELLSVQSQKLEQTFDVRYLALPPDDLSDWDTLTQRVTHLIRAELHPDRHRPVYLCGESFGGCLALKVIRYAPSLFDRLVLVNPASSCNRSPLVLLGTLFSHITPEPLYQLSCLGFLPLLAALDRIAPHHQQSLLKAVRSVHQTTSNWRLSLVKEFSMTTTELQHIHQPTLVVASGSDRLLPSVAEAQFLMHHLPNAQVHLLPASGHACLLETDVDLYDILNRYRFLPPTLPSPQGSRPSPLRRREASRRSLQVLDDPDDVEEMRSA